MNYARWVHFVGTAFHLAYVILFLIYVDQVYLRMQMNHKNKLLLGMTICLSYATIYDLTQFYNQGFDYFHDIWNYSDQMHIWGGYTCLYFQYCWNEEGSPRSFECQITMILSTIMLLIKTFFFLRIF